MTNERRIEVLEWQNGLYRGLIAGLLCAVRTEMDGDETDMVVEEVRKTMNAPLPLHLREDDPRTEHGGQRDNDVPF